MTIGFAIPHSMSTAPSNKLGPDLDSMCTSSLELHYSRLNTLRVRDQPHCRIGIYLLFSQRRMAWLASHCVLARVLSSSNDTEWFILSAAVSGARNRSTAALAYYICAQKHILTSRPCLQRTVDLSEAQLQVRSVRNAVWRKNWGSSPVRQA